MAPKILVTPGDPRGVGPEVALRAVEMFRERSPDVSVAFVGPDGPLEEDELLGLASKGRDDATDDEIAGTIAARSIERAAALATSGQAHAIVTAPLHKPSLHAAGWKVPGQTEMLGQLSGADSVGMLMAAERTSVGGPLRVLLATTHIALRDVPERLTQDLLINQIGLLDRALRRDWGIATPTIAVCGLNPHASDDGLFGSEEDVVIGPAIERSRGHGMVIEGPLPADTVFSRALAGGFDAVVAPYHDVGMAAFKTVSFGTGVNVTLGLPFVRTSPDHGTAFDLAGTGRAEAGSMLEAITLAHALAKKRFDMDSADV